MKITKEQVRKVLLSKNIPFKEVENGIELMTEIKDMKKGISLLRIFNYYNVKFGDTFIFKSYKHDEPSRLYVDGKDGDWNSKKFIPLSYLLERKCNKPGWF